MLGLMLALPNAFHTSSHLLAHLCALSPHHILVLHEVPRKLCLELCLGDVAGWKGGTCSMQRQIRLASDALTGFLLPSSLCSGTEGVWAQDTCGALQKRP